MKKLLFVFILLPIFSFGQIQFSGKITYTRIFSLTNGVKEIAYLDTDSCLHVLDSSSTIDELIKTCLKQSNEMTKLYKANKMLINVLLEYTKSAKYAKLKE